MVRCLNYALTPTKKNPDKPHTSSYIPKFWTNELALKEKSDLAPSFWPRSSPASKTWPNAKSLDHIIKRTGRSTTWPTLLAAGFQTEVLAFHLTSSDILSSSSGLSGHVGEGNWRTTTCVCYCGRRRLARWQTMISSFPCQTFTSKRRGGSG